MPESNRSVPSQPVVCLCCPLPSVITACGVSRSLASQALSGGAPRRKSLVSVKASKGAGSPLCHTADSNTFPQLPLSMDPFETFQNSLVLVIPELSFQLC